MPKYTCFDGLRSDIYMWLSTIFREELTKDDIDFYTSVDMVNFRKFSITAG